jgi:hypothetical protein
LLCRCKLPLQTCPMCCGLLMQHAPCVMLIIIDDVHNLSSQPVGQPHAGSLFSSRFSYVDTNDGVVGIRATAAGPDDGRTALYQCTVSISAARHPSDQ